MKSYLSGIATLLLCSNIYAEVATPTITPAQGQKGCTWAATIWGWKDGQDMSSSVIQAALREKNPGQFVVAPQSVVDTVLNLDPNMVTDYIFHCDPKRVLAPEELVVFTLSYTDPSSGEAVTLPEIKVLNVPPPGSTPPSNVGQPPVAPQNPNTANPSASAPNAAVQ